MIQTISYIAVPPSPATQDCVRIRPNPGPITHSTPPSPVLPRSQRGRLRSRDPAYQPLSALASSESSQRDHVVTEPPQDVHVGSPGRDNSCKRAAYIPKPDNIRFRVVPRRRRLQFPSVERSTSVADQRGNGGDESQLKTNLAALNDGWVECSRDDRNDSNGSQGLASPPLSSKSPRVSNGDRVEGNHIYRTSTPIRSYSGNRKDVDNCSGYQDPWWNEFDFLCSPLQASLHRQKGETYNSRHVGLLDEDPLTCNINSCTDFPHNVQTAGDTSSYSRSHGPSLEWNTTESEADCQPSSLQTPPRRSTCLSHSVTENLQTRDHFLPVSTPPGRFSSGQTLGQWSHTEQVNPRYKEGSHTYNDNNQWNTCEARPTVLNTPPMPLTCADNGYSDTYSYTTTPRMESMIKLTPSIYSPCPITIFTSSSDNSSFMRDVTNGTGGVGPHEAHDDSAVKPTDLSTQTCSVEAPKFPAVDNEDIFSGLSPNLEDFILMPSPLKRARPEVHSVPPKQPDTDSTNGRQRPNSASTSVVEKATKRSLIQPSPNPLSNTSVSTSNSSSFSSAPTTQCSQFYAPRTYIEETENAVAALLGINFL